MTHTTNFKRLVCCLLAVLMLCTCVLRPLEVRAVAVEAGLGFGVAVILILFTAGIVLHPKTAEQVVEIGRSLQDDLERKYGDTEEKLENIRKWCNEIDEQIRNRPDAPDDPEWSNTAIKLSRAALTAISAWIASVIAKGGVEVEYNDYACYNGALLPLIDTVWDKELYPYAFMHSDYSLYLSSVQPYTDNTYVCTTNANYIEYNLDENRTKWQYSRKRTGYTGPHFGTKYYLWSNCDILSTDGSLFASASEPLYETEEIIEFYRVPGSPLEDENGEPDPEEIEENLPEVIYPSRVLYDTQKTDLTEAVREVVRQLSEGEMTYEQYMEQIQGELGEVPGEGSETETQPGTSSDPTPDGSEDVEVKSGLRKLVDFFTGTTFVESPLQAMNFDKLFDLFPFNIPAGIYQTISFWNADATPPTLTLPSLAFDGNKVTGDEFSFNLADMPGMNEIAALIRAGVLILYAVGLLMITRKVTKW